MSRYIDADNYKKDLIQLGFLPALVVSVLDKQPSADVVEVRHGHWVHSTKEVGVNLYHRWQCSECGRTVARLNESDIEDLPYCHCGAKMDGERREQNEG